MRFAVVLRDRIEPKSSRVPAVPADYIRADEKMLHPLAELRSRKFVARELA